MISKKKLFTSLIILLVFGSIFVQVDLVRIFCNIKNIEGSPPKINLRKIGQFKETHEIVDVFIDNNFGFIADQVEGLLIVNLTNLASPTLINTYQIEDNSVYDIIVEDKIAYVAHGRAGLIILDVNDPNNIVELGAFNDGGICWKIFILENTLFVADRIQGLEIIDISNLNNPVKVGLYKCQPFDVFVQEELAFIAAGVNGGLEIIDISQLDSPQKIGEISFILEDTVSVFVKNDYAFIGNKENGLKIIKITRPRRPKLVFEYKPDDGSKIWGTFVDEKFAYLACESGGIQILDISDINDPYLIAQYSDENSGKAFDLMVKQDKFFVADFDDGLEIIEWETTEPTPMINDYHIVDSRILNFNHSVGPYAADAFLGDEIVGLNLSIFLDVGLMSPVNITVEAPRIVNPGDFINLRIGITAEESFFWGRFEGTIEFTTPLGSSELFSLQEVGIPKHVQLAAFTTFIGENITQDTTLLPVELWQQEFLNYSLSLVMIPFFNVTGSAIISARINNTIRYFDLTWTQDRDQIIIPIQIPSEVENFYALPLEELQFNIEELHLDLNNIRFDVLLADLVPLYSWNLNISSFSGLPVSESLKSNVFEPTQENNQTLLFLDGIYPLGVFIITIYFSSNIQLPIWGIFLSLLGIISLIVIPWILIATSSRRKTRKEPRGIVEGNE
ncbi:MAG: hypothetical protein FK730_05150 [Asgard group archaeon]|nr:hypothetical protein [Asgard group archaeon]